MFFTKKGRNARSIWTHQIFKKMRQTNRYFFKHMFDLVGRCLCFIFRAFANFYFQISKEYQESTFFLLKLLMPGSVKNFGNFGFPNCWYMKIICFNAVSLFSFIFEAFQHKKEVKRSTFGQHFGSSRNHPQSIAIHQEPLISHFGIIRTPTIPQHIINKPRKNKKNAYFDCQVDG